MGKVPQIKLPVDIDWRGWIGRWDRMQDRYIPYRKERFELMVRPIADTQQSVTLVPATGCRTGRLMLAALEKFPEAQIFGIDFDPTLLALAEKRLTEFGDRAPEDREGFWDAYGRALETDIRAFRSKFVEPWEGSEEGLPLEWHFERLRASGFEAVDCFWRCDCDAIYGGIRQLT